MYELNPTLKLKNKNEKFIIQWENNEKILNQDEILILKIISEKLNPVKLCKAYNLSLKNFTFLLYELLENEIVIKKEPIIKRNPAIYPLKLERFKNDFIIPETFTLQWHITNRCDLNCKHCYDRTKMEDVSLKDAIKIMEDYYLFCFKFSIIPQITFTGGNPFLHKDFFEIYKAADKIGFVTGILGNAVKEEWLKEIVKIQKPAFYQISLEGMPKYNDYIRGKGHFKRTINFLKILKKYDIFSNVMLTLHKGNINQVIDLAKVLKRLTDSFTFNRLSAIGEGKNLKIVTKNEYKNFLKKYLNYAENNNFTRLKDNLLNIILYKNNNSVFSGCTGFGCGAAFNFVALLSNGDVYACRKFPSKIGNIFEKNFETIYFSKIAESYRIGPEECKECAINRVCRGCLAVIHSYGFDYKKDKDPYCFLHNL